MDAAERDRELVARLAAERARLHVAQVMRVGRLAAADQAGLLGDVAQVVPVAVAARCGDREHALVDPRWRCRDATDAVDCAGRRRCGAFACSRQPLHCGVALSGVSAAAARQPLFEGILHQLRIGCGERVLGGKRAACPARRRDRAT